MFNKPIVDPSGDPKILLASKKSVSALEITTEFDEFEAQMKKKYGTKATATAFNLFAQDGEKGGERVVYELDYNLMSTSLFPVALSVLIVHMGLESNGYKFPAVALTGLLLSCLTFYLLSVSQHRKRVWKRLMMYTKPIMGSCEDPKVSLATQKSVCDQDIASEFVEFKAKMMANYGEKTTAATMKFYAQGAQERGDLNEEERDSFGIAMSLTTAALSVFMFCLTFREDYDFSLLAYFSICGHFLALYFHGSNIYHKRYSQFFSPSSLSIFVFITVFVFATHFSTFYFSRPRDYHSQ